MLQGRPLYDNAADAAFYVRPTQWERVQRAIDRQLNTLVVGERGTGKTSLLRQLQRVQRERGRRAVYVDATNPEDSMDLARRLQDALLGKRGPSGRRESAEEPAPGWEPSASQTFLETLDSLGRAEPTVALVDASSAGLSIYNVFGRMRDTLWQLPHLWVVAIDAGDRATVLRPPADAFFDRVVDLDLMSVEHLTDLLARRAPNAPPAMLRQVAELAQGNPRVALRALADADVDGRDPTAGLIERGLLLERASAVGRPYAMLMAELLDLGGASPSDLELQTTLGLSRGRLTKLLRDLLDQELVVAGIEKNEGVGRPRTIYRPNLRTS